MTKPYNITTRETLDTERGMAKAATEAILYISDTPDGNGLVMSEAALIEAAAEKPGYLYTRRLADGRLALMAIVREEGGV